MYLIITLYNNYDKWITSFVSTMLGKKLLQQAEKYAPNEIF